MVIKMAAKELPQGCRAYIPSVCKWSTVKVTDVLTNVIYVEYGNKSVMVNGSENCYVDEKELKTYVIGWN